MGKKKAGLLIVNASELATMAGPARARRGQEMSEIGAIQDGAIAVYKGKIVATGQTREILRDFDSSKCQIIDASGKTVAPGFVDAHTHLIFAGSREKELVLKIQGRPYMDILKSGGGILSTVRATRNATRQQLFDSASARLHVMLEHGTTSAEAKTGYGLSVRDELKSLDVISQLRTKAVQDIVPTFLGAHAVPPESTAEIYIDTVIRKMLPRIGTRAKYCDVFCEDGVFTPAQSRRLLKAAKKAGLAPKIHADEFVDTGGAALAAEVGAASAEHLLCSSVEGLRAMAKSGTVAVLLPSAALSLMGGKYANARAMIDLGIPVALGTDLSPNSWTESMQFVMNLACYNMRMTPAECLCAATINSAHAIGLGKQVGSLEPGKQADIVILDAPSHLFLGYHMGLNQASAVIKRGHVAWARGQARDSPSHAAQ